MIARGPHFSLALFRPFTLRTMAVSLLTLLVLIVAFSAEVGWLCRC
jgi:hypothetical protein